MEQAQRVTNMIDTKINTNFFTNPFAVATVVNNSDPQNSYRIKVRIPIVHDQVPDEYLPWAARVSSPFLGFGDASINHAVPEVGTKVLTLFVANDPNSILYIGSLYKNNSATPSGNNYLGTYGIYSQKGEFIGVDKIAKTLKLIYEGKIDISKITEATISVNGPISVKAGSTTIDCSTNTINGDVTINGSLKVSKTIDADDQITSKVEVKAMETTLTKHIHKGVFPGPSDTSPGVG